jgi:hypothetical protein
MMQRSINGNKVHGISITTVQAIRSYTESSTEMAGKGSSPELSPLAPMGIKVDK